MRRTRPTSPHHGRRPGERGQALVEMALILPVLLILIIGMLEFSRAWSAKQAVTDAAREGARLAVVQNVDVDQTDVTAAIATSLSRAGIPGWAATIQFDETPGPAGKWRNTGEIQQVYVAVDYRFSLLGPLIRMATGSETIRMASLVAMRNE
jgi:Flp pilus assembly protein TadG